MVLPMRNTIVLQADDYEAQLALSCSAEQAAELLGLHAERVKQFCRQGRLAAVKRGREWTIATQAVKRFAALYRPTGLHLEAKAAVKTRANQKSSKKVAKSNR